MKKRFFSSILEIDLNQNRKLSRRDRQITTLRMLLFLAIVFSAAAAYDQHCSELYILPGTFLLLFIILLRFHTRTHELQLFLRSHMAILSQYMARFNGEWHSFKTDGALYLSDKQPQSLDLSIFGPDSIYQYICAARTRRGRDRLAAALSPKPRDFTHTKKRQQAVAELIKRPRLCVDLEALAALLPENHDTTSLIQFLADKPPAPSPILHRLAWGLPCLAALSLLAAALGRIDWLVPGALFGLQLLLALFFAGQSEAALEPLHHLHQELRLYDYIFRRIEDSTFSSPYLNELQHRLKKDPSAAHALHQLALLSDYTHMRSNMVFAFLANSLVLWDFHCRAYFASWQKDAARHLKEWLDVWSEFEVLLSLAVIGHTRETSTFPQLLEQKTPVLKAQALTHLLLPEDHAVANDTDAASETCIITGSNMSGKTTYLRTLATACILAYAGGPVCAKHMQVSKLYIFTSIRVTDDTARGLSTFYAELLRIKSMIDFRKKALPMFICIDEIFKGTNSADRIIGAREAIRHLTDSSCITMVSTHDFELCTLESPNETPVINYHFEEHYDGDKILFDYKIKPGRCQTTNATYLLKMAGIME